MINTLFVQHRSPHHAKNSGYDRLIDYYHHAKAVSGVSRMPYKLAKVLSSMVSQKAGLYNSDSVYKELELFGLLKAKNQSIVHYLNAERDVRFAIKYKRLFNNPIFLGTFHKPASILDWRIQNTAYVNSLNGAIAVGVNQVDYLRERFKIPHVTYIPHGVDTQFFFPDLTKRKANRLLFVGQHLRDFKALNYCIPRIAEHVKDLSVQVIIHPGYIDKVVFHKSITILSGLDDVGLRRAYQEASVLFLPMLDSTACNSILEAMACGLPVVTNAVGGNMEYLKDTDSFLMPILEYDGLIEEVKRLLSDTLSLERLSRLGREKALNYDWEEVSSQVLKFHKSLLLEQGI
ncbi:glycosyltransferase family 4 protein [Mangrovimonas xylaniphaga]|uniref:glycosyltransferase family 4 protein n=1 Tax=Mangrovimonas xylaniphaga TaxID=1645915 RepID=UPI000AEF1C74|nr:glycosyltransferase family 4 protein [Mangrovimonas xylaniphaga]